MGLNVGLAGTAELAKNALPKTGGTLTNNGRVLELKNTTSNSLYIQGTNHNDAGQTGLNCSI
ncbi:hypothetical protein [Xenorhabdus ehlersii]|uniref:hypothetical protein n=1 Tax=Xenorhabdus ehlersii TaxID=290111 RepID=UPI000C049E2C|nr:hypothetical protein [Xenorhabdus ehlersii]